MRLVAHRGSAVVAATVLVLASCGGSGDDTSNDPIATTELGTSTPTEATTSSVATTGFEPTEKTALAQSLVDEFYAALVETDPQTAAGLFADDGVFVDKNGGRREGPEGVSAYVEQVGPGITHCERVGAVEVVDAGSYRFPVEFTYAGTAYANDVALTIENDLITLHEWQTGS